MSRAARVLLLVTAALCAGFVTFAGASFSRDAEPEHFGASSVVFFFLGGVVVAVPLWAPALIPSGYPMVLKVGRWLSAAALVFPTLGFGSIVVNYITRILARLDASMPALLIGTVLTSGCLACLFVLVWPELASLTRRKR